MFPVIWEMCWCGEINQVGQAIRDLLWSHSSDPGITNNSWANWIWIVLLADRRTDWHGLWLIWQFSFMTLYGLKVIRTKDGWVYDPKLSWILGNEDCWLWRPARCEPGFYWALVYCLTPGGHSQLRTRDLRCGHCEQCGPEWSPACILI